jgi:hypothetical protein
VKVFISWSGPESRQIAEAVRDWLPTMFESVEPYMSARDNEAGVRWSSVISGALEDSDFGILCLTPTNLSAPWLLFEAGALSKSVDAARVVPLLWRLATSDVTSPLSQFHMKSADEAGMRDVVTSLNGALERPRPDQALSAAFTGLWPQLQERLRAVQEPGRPEAPHRKDRELLEEILELVRNTSQTVNRPRIPIPSRAPDRVVTTLSDIDFMERIGKAIGPGVEILRTGNGRFVILAKDENKADSVPRAHRDGRPGRTPKGEDPTSGS